MIVFARYRSGQVSEAKRVCHAFEIADDGTMPTELRSLCGQPFPPGVLELMQAWAGMPCIGCTLKMPTVEPIEQ